MILRMPPDWRLRVMNDWVVVEERYCGRLPERPTQNQAWPAAAVGCGSGAPMHIHMFSVHVYKK